MFTAGDDTALKNYAENIPLVSIINPKQYYIVNNSIQGMSDPLFLKEKVKNFYCL